jgi:hypothetical protein
MQKKSKIKPGKFIAAGTCGEVYEVEGDPTRIIKVPVGYVKRGSKDTSTRRRDVKGTKQDIIEEMKTYKKLKLSKEDVFLPSKAVKLSKNSATEKNVIGIVRPKINTSASKMTYSQIAQLRKKIIALSIKGIVLSDGVQAGIDAKGNTVIYDTGFVKKRDPEDAFNINEYKWERFILQNKKSLSRCGKITP